MKMYCDPRRPLRAAATLSLMGLLLGALSCTNYRSYRNAQVAEAAEDWDRAVLEYLELVNRDPADLRYRASLLRAKMAASHGHFEQAKKYREAGLLRQAMIELQKAVQLDPTNQYARSELDKVRADIAAAEAGLGHRQTLAEMKEGSEGTRPQPPILNPRSPEPLDLDFSEPASIKKIYQALGKAFGINVMFDPNLRDQEMSIQLKEVTAQTALETVMRTAQHFYKVLDEHTIIVVADTPQNRRIYEDLIIQTFFLSNSDVKEVMTMLRSLVDSRKIAANEQLNAIILRDTVDKVKVAERIIQSNDKAKAEVVVDIELLQLNTSKLQDLGLSLDSYNVTAQLDTGGGAGADTAVPLRLNDIEFINSSNWLLTVPSFLFDFVKNSTEAQTLAKPQLRISEGESARLTIGDRVPVPVTSFNTANTVGSNIVPLTSFQYQDVGIRIEIEPRVHHNEEISLQLMVEVSNIAGNVGDQPIIGTRMIETTIRLKDGETNFLAGLIRSDETNSEDGIPGLSEIPLLGRLFSKKRSQNARTDIVLTLTPHIIRRADITEQDLMPIWVGTEQNVTFRGGSPRIESGTDGPFEGAEEGDDAADEVRRRLQRLPRGLRPGGGEGQEGDDEPVEEPPSGVDLVPAGRPRNPLDRSRPPSEPPPNMSWLDRLPSGGSSGIPRGGYSPRSGGPGLVGALGLGAVSLGNVALSRLAIGTGVVEISPEPVALKDGSPALASLTDDEPPSSMIGRVSAAGSDDPDGGPEGPNPPIDPPDDPIDPGPGDLVLVGFTSESARVRAGDIFEVGVDVASAATVSHLPLRLRFDPEALELVGASEGAWFASNDNQVEVLSAAPSPGLAIVGASRLGTAPGVLGGGQAIRLRFRGLEPGGSSTLTLSRAEALSSELIARDVAVFRDTFSIAVTSRQVPKDAQDPRPAVKKAAAP